jgi:hypothetical protein
VPEAVPGRVPEPVPVGARLVEADPEPEVARLVEPESVVEPEAVVRVVAPAGEDPVLVAEPDTAQLTEPEAPAPQPSLDLADGVPATAEDAAEDAAEDGPEMDGPVAYGEAEGPEASPGPYPGSVLPLPDGSAPAPDFVVKGNTGSMRSHGPRSPYFGRTRAEVWFRTDEDAVAAGFRPWTPRK